MTLKTDNFTGADGQLLTARTDWSQRGGGSCRAVVNASNQIKSVAGGDGSTVCVDTGANDMYAQCVGLSDFGTNDGWPLAVRVTDRNSYIAGRWNSVDSLWELHTQFGRVTSAAGSFASGDVIRLEVVANVATIKKNGTTVLTDTVPAITASNYAGMFLRIAKDPVLDDWQSDSIGGADTTIPTLTGTITEVSKTANSISISWPAGADNVAVTSYEVSSNGGTSYTDVGNVLTYAFTSLSPSTAYALRVRAKDGASLVSTPALAITITTLAADTTNPAFPGGTTLGFTTKTSTSVALTASADATDNIAVTGYEWSSDGGTTYPFTSLTRSFTFTALSPLTSYNFRVRGYDGAGLKTAALSLATSTYRAGDTGQNIFDNTGPVGGNPEGFLRNKVTLPADAAKWFSYVITTPPATGSFSTLNPNGTFVFTGPNAETMLVQLEVDGANFGSPFVVSLYDSTSQVATPGNVTSVVSVTPSACTQGFVATPGPVTSLVSVTPSVCTQSLTAAVVLPLNLTSAVSVSPSFVRLLTLDPSANRLRMPADGNTRRYLGKFFKRPVEMDDYDIEAADYLATVEDTLIFAEVTADAGITVDAFRLVGSFVKVWVSGGVKRGRYKLTVRVTTAEGRIKELKFMVVMPAG